MASCMGDHIIRYFLSSGRQIADSQNRALKLDAGESGTAGASAIQC